MKYHELIDLAKKVHEKKTHDYAEVGNKFSNFQYAAQVARPFPECYKPYATLIGIKLARLSVLLSSGNVPANESIEDSFIDLVNYCALLAEFATEAEDIELEYREGKADYESGIPAKGLGNVVSPLLRDRRGRSGKSKERDDPGEV